METHQLNMFSVLEVDEKMYLQKGNVLQGVPALRRSELDTEFEDFSNVISSLSDFILYKGTLSSRVKIVLAITCAKDWSKDSQSQFRKKVEAEHLDWAARLQIAMEIAYCIEHMQELVRPKYQILNSIIMQKILGQTPENSDPQVQPLSDPKIIVYKFGIILLEILSRRGLFLACLPNGLRVISMGQDLLKDMIDQTLKSFRENDLGALSLVVNSCTDPDPTKRPTMSEVTHQLWQITTIAPDVASSRLSPLWWPELEILSEASKTITV